MIEIKLTYGVDIDVEAPQLRRLAAALLVLAGDEAHKLPALIASAVPVPVVGGPVQGNGARATASPVHIDAPYGEGWKIAPNDVPSVGAESEEVDPAAVFGGAVEPDPAQVFGAGNVAAGSAIASSPSPASTVAVLPPPPVNGPVAVSGDAVASLMADLASTPDNPDSIAATLGNGQGATSATPSGTPGVPNSGAATGGVQIDSRGLPWDVRIHAGTKTTNKDLSWKKKPNVDAALVAQVETELRAIMAIPVPGNVMRQESAETATAPIDPALIAQARAAIGAPATPPAIVVPPPPPASAPGNAIPTPPVLAPTTGVGAISSFAQLLPAVTNGIANGTLTEQRVAEVLASVGCQVLPQIAPRPDLVAAVAAALFPVA